MANIRHGLKALGAIGIGTIGGLLLVAAADGALGLYERMTSAREPADVGPRPSGLLAPPEGVRTAQYEPGVEAWQQDGLLNLSPFQLIPNHARRHQLRDHDHFVFDVTYHTDEFGRRLTVSSVHGPKSKFAVFFGCSFVFGTAVRDDQTLPSSFERVAPGYRSYNYGIQASGPGTMLRILEQRDLKSEIREREGVAIYAFIPQHLGRTVSDSFWTIANPTLPDYELDEKGKPRYVGFFAEARPWTTWFYRLLGASHLAHRLSVRLPREYGRQDQELLCRIVAESRDRFLALFPKSSFYFLNYPFAQLPPRKIAYLKDCLARMSVPVLDWTIPFDEKYLVPFDGHPTGALNEKIALELSRRLGR